MVFYHSLLWDNPVCEVRSHIQLLFEESQTSVRRLAENFNVLQYALVFTV